MTVLPTPRPRGPASAAIITVETVNANSDQAQAPSPAERVNKRRGDSYPSGFRPNKRTFITKVFITTVFFPG